ncbi:hypothetical protein BC777_1078 [Yoonia maricola]|uniref:Uncharacterized protein n=1 Tax=Yoonia maricola TaxID=420999 RepID=A0A2M8WMU1_9RHOB|nr:hypothetical protein [Yoonia maricola]PJI92233.1 hypothetical protein BC777_1078 [Yoonia maricola]
MDEFSHTNSNTSSGSGVGFLVAAVIVVLVLLYALFAGGGASTTVDPATVGTAQDGAPAIEETAPTQPVAPTAGE